MNINKDFKELAEEFAKFFTLSAKNALSLVLMLFGLIESRSGNVKQASSKMPTTRSAETNYTRALRFIRRCCLEIDKYSKFVLKIFPQEKYILTIDRTNWKYGKLVINIYMVSIVVKSHNGKDISIPFYFKFLPKEGSSSTEERIEITESFTNILDKERIECIIADREFPSYRYMEYLNKKNIKFCMRVRKDACVNSFGNNVKLEDLFNNTKYEHNKPNYKTVSLNGYTVNVFYRKNRNSDNSSDDMYVITNNPSICDGIKAYETRWSIETQFLNLKSNGFNIESTKLRSIDRVSQLLMICSIAYCWSYGTYTHNTHKSQYLFTNKSNGRPQKCPFGFGLDLLSDMIRIMLLNRCSKERKRDIKFLVKYLFTPSLYMQDCDHTLT